MNIPAKETILNEFLRGFSGGALSVVLPENASIEEMKSSAFKVSTEVGDWLVKLTNKKGEQLEKENGLVSALNAKEGDLFIPYCRTKTGASYLSMPEDYGQALKLVAMAFIENSPAFKWTNPTWTPSHSEAAGRSLKKFHTHSKACLDDRSIAADTYEIVPIARIRSSLLDKIDHAGKDPTNLFENCLPPFETLRATIINQRFNEIETLPCPVVSHGDFHPGNILFEGTTVNSIIDFDAEFCFRGNPLFDLSYALIAFSAHWQGERFAEKKSVKDYLARDHFQSLWSGYYSHAPANETMDPALRQALCYSCMLFLHWAFDSNLTNSELPQRVFLNASGLLAALDPEGP
jgi:Ser/Thr protein kinase RdoA (MazF antagonist)